MLLPSIILVFVITADASPQARAKRAGVLGLGELAGAVGPEYRYINVEGYEDCLIEHFKEGQLSDEYCLPTSKLPGCSNSVWMQLKELYDPNSRVINDQDSRAAPPGAPPGADVPVGLGAPAYLSIPGFDLCLEEHNPTGDTASYRCVPATKPEYCSKKAWEELRVTETFGVVEGTCPGSYTDVPGYQQCILDHPGVESNNGHCLPLHYKPDYCSEKSWNVIHRNVFQ